MLIKLSQLAKELGLTDSTLYGWARKGLITFTKSPTGRNYISEKEYARITNGKKTNSSTESKRVETGQSREK